MVEKIKMLTLRALVSDEKLMYGLVLKGGNALQLAYNITDRASLDIDFSIEGDFSPEEFKRIEMILYGLLNTEFEKHNLYVFDIRFIEKPKQNKVKEWKGYLLNFKVIDADLHDPDDVDKSRRLAHKIYPNQSTQFQVEISSYEYTANKKIVDVDGTIFYVYTPEMIVFEKIRALCQSIPEYREIIPTARQKGRARDFYDIWNLCNSFGIDFTSEKNKIMFKNIFDAKLVPIHFLDLLPQYKDFQKEDWNSVVDTLTATDTKGFDFYFNFVMDKVKDIKNLEDNTYSK
ncbi:nucleotidyl transferase AbiEii/AbiGii toxin family protein [Tenacibaculum agarivorans]|uniref:nucleotidyl transferase AbiEii/AbiGii toxin family protein n=1 Tax=Tenacibaculum agarivorans TaxID=1908389 RepID=UPI00094BA136|nr:nucleotidyl transferase AbiEii/AbiGii toxin family protein [Tenacibaculum agarivorans]